MLALEAKIAIDGPFLEPRLMKLAGLAEFVAGDVAPERMLLDLRDPSVAAHGALIDLPWAGFVLPSTAQPIQERLTIRLLDDDRVAQPGDVVEIQPARGKLATRYRRGASGNVLFATERCNSFCLMCSQPPRAVDDHWRVHELCDLVSLIDRTEPSLAISGGEPTLLGDGLTHVVQACAHALPTTHIHILSNGRRFGEDLSAQPFDGLHPALSWGIPLYGDTAALHDYVVQRRGAFGQTLRGLYALAEANQRIEIRVVLVKPVVERLPQIARFICRNLPFVEHVALMGVEPIGFALAHRDALWLDPMDAAPALSEAVGALGAWGIAPSLYNMPLCVLPRQLWPYARRSISDWKQDYTPACSNCAVMDQCSGVFGWKAKGWQSRAIQPILIEAAHA